MTLVERLKAARKVAVPIIAVSSPDPAQTVRTIREAFDNSESKTPIPIVSWDAVNGLTGLNEVGRGALAQILGADDTEWPGLSANPNSALVKMADLPGEQRNADNKIIARGALGFMHNAQLYFQ